MSNWIHINAKIRFDEFFGDCKYYRNTDMKIKKLFSKCLLGSEGSLKFSIIDDAYNRALSISGDLRHGYNDNDKLSIDYITKWFENICNNLDVRQAFIQINNEVEGEKYFVYENKWNTNFDDNIIGKLKEVK